MSVKRHNVIIIMVLIDHGDMAHLDSLWTSMVGSQE